MSKFKVGDKVKRIDKSDFLTVGEVYTVTEVGNSGFMRVSGYATGFNDRCFELVIDNETIRKEITDAVRVLSRYNVWRDQYGIIGEAKNPRGSQLDAFLDAHYPLKTPQQLEIEAIRKEQEKLAERLKQLEG